MHKPPLSLHLLFHPKSETARAFAEQLRAHFMEPPASGGLRLPVFFTPDRGDDLPPLIGDELRLDNADHTLVVVLADSRMVRRVIPSDTGPQWEAFLERLSVETESAGRRHHVFAVALDERGFGISKTRHVVRARLTEGDDSARARALNEVSLQTAVRAIQLLRGEVVADQAGKSLQIPVRLFLSHAKADLDPNRADLVRAVMAAHQELPIQPWFDSEQIGPGEEFAQVIQAGVQDSTILVAFLTDRYASRPWCRREVLEAKRLGAPILVVDALEQGEPRNFPYLGNLPVLHWNAAAPELSARQVVERAVRESLRFLHNRKATGRFAKPGDRVLASAPEALTLAHASAAPDEHPVFFYPDPPLSREELGVLEGLRPSARFVTPLTRLAASGLPETKRLIGVSISESDDLARWGLSNAHQQTLADEVHLYLLMAGAQIAYGGSLKYERAKADNVTLRLFELVRGYSSLAQDAGREGLHAIVNFAPWPLYLGYTDTDLDLFDRVAEYRPGDRPALPWMDEEIFPGGRLPADTAQRRYAWTRGLTTMRQTMTEQVAARLVIGGKLKGYAGIYPGVLEEAWMSIAADRPLYLVGAFGGVARAVIDVLEGGSRPELGDAAATVDVPHYRASCDLFAAHGGDYVPRDQMVTEIAEKRQAGPGAALCNGLDDEENRLLFHTADPARIAELVLTGLGRLPFG